eukprot:CAMPEP_0182496958 /NCGR_PEP_ID=MMETSP1321-20130603/5531_1 /TAXON_ID=91990 /ORGANISM="Bolidomonas sp., Strain RCC1657" /LENGTH=91 /DNA_ID=CAMNT_0024700713 /DNA_START=1743 /DNA_END=2018 /DNA_ORIENTATION=+
MMNGNDDQVIVKNLSSSVIEAATLQVEWKVVAKTAVPNQNEEASSTSSTSSTSFPSSTSSTSSPLFSSGSGEAPSSSFLGFSSVVSCIISL